MPKLKISPEEVPFRAVFFLETIQWVVGAFVYNEGYKIEYSTIVLVPFVLGCAVMSLIDSVSFAVSVVVILLGRHLLKGRLSEIPFC